jgi:GxxExxY protein
MAHLPHYEKTSKIIGAYYEVYNHTPRYYPERIFEAAMIEELRRRNMTATRQDEYQIIYKDRVVGLQRLDLFVVDEIVVENKVVECLKPIHKAQGISYIKTVGRETGLLLNFGGRIPEFNRLFFNPAKKPSADGDAHPSLVPSADWLYPDLAYQIVGGLYEIHNVLGAGYVHRIYCHACDHEMRLLGLDCNLRRQIQASYKDVMLGEMAFGHILVEGQVMVFPVAVGNLGSIHLENLKRWMRLCEIRLGIIANFDAVHLDVKFIRT